VSDIAIKLENISKQYRLGTVGTGTLSHDLNRWFAKVRGKEDPSLKIGQSNQLALAGGDYVWALKDINLEIKQGEILGIIGKNGAGKSTLLKLLSQVTGPTTGSIKVNGRIASLLEVGTGFHPELTGRENIFLNGAILGMRKWEIKKKLDEIVDFAGVAKYLDTPVKRYSSGMYVRLAFAVAAHLEPDILVVDEVLAVGDAEFQKKAIGKMQDVSRGGGRTVLFVSHNMASIQALCNRGVLLENGTISFVSNNIENVICKYKNQTSTNDSEYTKNVNRRLLEKCKTDGFLIESLLIFNKNKTKDIIESGDDFILRINYRTSKQFPSPAFVFIIKDEYDLEIVRFSNMPISNFPIRLKENGIVNLEINNTNLVKGTYYIDLGFVHEKVEWYFKVEKIIKLDIESKDIYNSGVELDRTRGLIWQNHKWSLNS